MLRTACVMDSRQAGQPLVCLRLSGFEDVRKRTVLAFVENGPRRSLSSPESRCVSNNAELG